MRIFLTRLSNEGHRLRIERPDGSCVESELETRSVFLHDLVHYAIEAEAGIEDGFWGLLAQGTDFGELREEIGTPMREGIALAESLVGPMQSVWKQQLEPGRYVEMLSRTASFVDSAFVDRVLERIRKLWGHWRGTPFHESMNLRWPPGD